MKTKTMSEIYNFSTFFGFIAERGGGGVINYVAYTDLICTLLDSSSTTSLSFKLLCPSPHLVVSTEPFDLILGSARLLGGMSWFSFLFCCLKKVCLKASSSLSNKGGIFTICKICVGFYLTLNDALIGRHLLKLVTLCKVR